MIKSVQPEHKLNGFSGQENRFAISLDNLAPGIRKSVHKMEKGMHPNTVLQSKSGDISSHLYSVLEFTDEIFFTLDEDAVVTQTNRNISLLGYTPEEFTGKSLLEIVHPEDLPDLLALIAECVPLNKAVKGFRYRLLHKNGTWRWLHSSAMPVFDADGNFLFITGLARDITAQIEQEAVILENEARYRQLFYHHPMPQWIADAQTLKFLEVNEAAVNHYGFSRNEFLGMSLYHILTESETIRPPKANRLSKGGNKDISRLSGVWHHVKKTGDIIEVEAKLQLTSIKGKEAFLYTINDITEKRKAERELEASEQRYRLFIQQSSGGVWRFDLKEPCRLGISKEEIIEHFYKNCYLAECNDAMAQMYGLEKKEDLIGKECEFFLPRNEPASLDFFDEFIENNFRVKNSISYEKDIFGNPKVFLNNYAANIEDGYIIRTWGTQRDITVRHEAEQKVKYLATIVENASDAIFSCGTDRSIISWNKACEEMFHYTNEEVTGKILSTIVHFEFPTASYMEAFTKVHKDGFWKGEVHFVNKFGKRVNMLTSISCVKNDKGVLTGYILIHKDITERKQVEQNLRESEERFILVNKATNEAIIDNNILTGETIFGDGFKRLFGYEPDGIETTLSFWIGKVHPEDRPLLQQVVKDILSTGNTLIKGIEFRFQKADGNYAFISATGYIVRDEEGKPVRVVSAMRDISEQKKMEQKLIKEMMNKQKAIHRASLEGSEKEREAISRELHDNVNQILSATKLFMEIAHKDEDKREMFIEKSIFYVKSVINEIRKLSRSLSSPTLGDLGLKAAIETLVQEIHQTEKLTIDYYYASDLAPNFDDTMNLTLYRIVQEQITNILKYARTQTTSIQLKKKKDNLVLTIRDEGVGFDKNKVKKGLGLSNITNRASLMNGTVSLKTAPGKGCTLEVTIPLNQNNCHKEQK